MRININDMYERTYETLIEPCPLHNLPTQLITVAVPGVLEYRSLGCVIPVERGFLESVYQC